MAFPRGLITMLAAATCLALGLMQAEPVSGAAERTARDAALAGIGVYVALRSVNAALSIAQEVEVGGSFGLSANAQPLMVLEPIDDTVERVAGAIFTATLLAAVLAAGVGPVSSLGFLLLAAGLAIHAVRGPLERKAGPVARPVCRAGTVSNLTGLLLAVVLPVSLALGGMLAERLTQAEWEDAMAQVTAVEERSKELIGTADAAGAGGSDPGVLTRLQDSVDQVGAYWDAVGYYLSQADDLLKASLTLIALFLLRTLVLPLALVAVMIALMRQFGRR